jgi:hypothetical protein
MALYKRNAPKGNGQDAELLAEHGVAKLVKVSAL